MYGAPKYARQEALEPNKGTGGNRELCGTREVVGRLSPPVHAGSARGSSSSNGTGSRSEEGAATKRRDHVTWQRMEEEVRESLPGKRARGLLMLLV